MTNPVGNTHLPLISADPHNHSSAAPTVNSPQSQPNPFQAWREEAGSAGKSPQDRIYSVKLTQIPVGQQDLSIKIKYERERTPTSENPLDGLLDYSQISKTIENLLSSDSPFDFESFSHQVEEALTQELKRQGIDEGKYKFTLKEHQSSKDVLQFSTEINGDVARFRIEGSVEGTAINHGHFLENQKTNATGISVENLNWVIKLECPSKGLDAAKLESIFDGEAFRTGVTNAIRDGLGSGDALELVNGAVKELMKEKLKELNIDSCKAKLSLKRPQVLQDALVVIGETNLFQWDKEKATDRERKYVDFSLSQPKD